jgi:hypothetical protein
MEPPQPSSPSRLEANVASGDRLESMPTRIEGSPGLGPATVKQTGAADADKPEAGAGRLPWGTCVQEHEDLTVQSS